MVLDPEHAYIPWALACPVDQHVEVDVAPTAPIEPATLEEAVRGVDGILQDDMVERAGYVGAVETWSRARVVRDGRIVAAFLVRDGSTVLAGGVACAGSGIDGA